MSDPHIYALLWMSTMSERDRRTTDETAGRMFAGLALAFRRLRGARRAARSRVLLQAETSTR
jgi:hypothetical protein